MKGQLKVSIQTNGWRGRMWRMKHQNASAVDCCGAALSEGPRAAVSLTQGHMTHVPSGFWSRKMWSGIISRACWSSIWPPVVSVSGGNTEAVTACSLSQSQLCISCHYIQSNSVKSCTFLSSPSEMMKHHSSAVLDYVSSITLAVTVGDQVGHSRDCSVVLITFTPSCSRLSHSSAGAKHLLSVLQSFSF